MYFKFFILVFIAATFFNVQNTRIFKKKKNKKQRTGVTGVENKHMVPRG